MEKKSFTDDNIMYILGAILFFLIIILAPLYYLDIFIPSKYLPPCFFHAVTGLSCPGCGSTRAVTALFNGHFIESLKFNPIIIYFFIIYIPFMLTNTVARIRNYIYKKQHSENKGPYKGMTLTAFHFYSAIVLLLGFFVVRLIFEIKIMFF